VSVVENLERSSPKPEDLAMKEDKAEPMLEGFDGQMAKDYLDQQVFHTSAASDAQEKRRICRLLEIQGQLGEVDYSTAS
jgi:hypothetical protein